MPRDPDLIQVNIRLPRGLYADFVEACTSEDRQVSQIMRDLMREYVHRINRAHAQRQEADHE
jgi:hypothetical protein